MSLIISYLKLLIKQQKPFVATRYEDLNSPGNTIEVTNIVTGGEVSHHVVFLLFALMMRNLPI